MQSSSWPHDRSSFMSCASSFTTTNSASVSTTAERSSFLKAPGAEIPVCLLCSLLAFTEHYV
jgi:hypothetical protein